MATCTNNFYAEDQDGNSLPFGVGVAIYRYYSGSWHWVVNKWIDSPSGATESLITGDSYKAVPDTDHDDYVTPKDKTWTACQKDITLVYKKIICTPGDTKCVGDDVYKCNSKGTAWNFSESCPGGCSGGSCVVVAEDPVITSISWSPKGSFHNVAAGASFTGRRGSTFRVIAVGPSTTPPLKVEEVSVELAGASAKVYKRGDSFVLNGEGFTIVHVISDGECSHVVIARNESTNQHPTIGEKVTFVANIDWNDDGATATTRRLEWFFFKPPSESYTKAYSDNINNWTHFATGTMPAHTFNSIGDDDIIYIKVIARNKADQRAEFGVGMCSRGLFNLWHVTDGFEITVGSTTGTEDLTIMTAALVPGTNAWMAGVVVLRWDEISSGVYFGTRDNVGCAYSDPTPDLCGSTEMKVGTKYAIFRSTSFISVVPGESIFELGSGRTPVTADRTYQNFLETTICAMFGYTGNECIAFVAELYDPVFIANYISIARTEKDTFGNARKLTAFDHIALPFAVLGSLPVLGFLPFGAVVSKGLGALSKTGAKFGDEAARFMLDFSMDARNFVSTKDTWRFLDAMGQVTEAHATEIVNALTAGDTRLADTLIKRYAGESKGWWDYRTLNDLLRDGLPTKTYNWLRTQIGLTEIGAGTVTNVAKQATLSPDCVLKLADAVKDSGVMDEASLAVYRSLRILDTATPQYIDEVRNILKNSPEISVKLVARHKTILDDVAAGRLAMDKTFATAILNHADLAPDDIVGMVKDADNLALIVNKLSNGTYSQALGNFLDSTKKYWDCINTNIGKTQADTWTKNNAEVARKAMKQSDADVAKMADIPHAVQEVAAKQGDLIADYCGGHPASCIDSTSDDLLGTGRTVADELYDEMDDFATTSANGWEDVGKAYAKNVDDRRYGWFSRLSDVNKERAVHGMVGASLVFALVILVKIYTDAGPQTLNHKIFVQKLEQFYWPCFNACADGNAIALAEAISIYEDKINECEASLAKYKTALEDDGTYTQFFNVLKLHQFNLAHFKDCLAGLGPTGTIRCTSNTNFFYVDLDRKPAGFSYANYEVLLTEVGIGSHTVKIHKSKWTPECTKSVTVTEGTVKTVDCHMTEVGACSPVTDVKIYIDPLSPVVDERITFNGGADSDDPIATWKFDFGDGSTSPRQAVAHSYSTADTYIVELVVTNDCGESASSTRAITVTEKPVEESGTLLVKKPIDAVTGVECKRAWEAEIYVDGQTIGKTTPFSIPFGTDTYVSGYGGPCGTHTITILLSGYDNVSETLSIDDGDTRSWQPEMYPLGTAPGFVICNTAPTGAAIWVAGTYHGDTNKTIELPRGKTRVTFKKTGYTDCTVDVTVIDGTVLASCTLVATAPAHDIDFVVPVGAAFYIDGEYKGTTRTARLSTILKGLRKE